MLVTVVGLLVGCASSPSRLDRYQALSPTCKEAYDKYHQFMTENQQERYLLATSEDERARMIADLHVEERLAKYPQYIQDAIWSQEIVPGMNKEAVLLSWGRPDESERLAADAAEGGVSQEHWYYRRGPNARERLIFIDGVVHTVEKP